LLAINAGKSVPPRRLHSRQCYAVLRPLRPGEAGLHRRQVEPNHF
jgi:hypothetical protein